jgi:trans-L-3-hydroxyproline dehydratase
MHTGGEPVRIILEGYPAVPGDSILAKRRFVRENLDHLRKLLMFEPRGHADMYGALLVEPSLPGADLAVLFMHNEGYSTMCGHATIALGRYAVDEGLVRQTEPFTAVGLECPCGLVKVQVEVKDGRAGRVSFASVPAFLHTGQLWVEVPGQGPILCDVAYGGAFYAIADAAQFGLDVRTSPLHDLVAAATALSAAVNDAIAIEHPLEPDLGFLYGSILTDGVERPGDGPSANVYVFADAEVDRSPTGSGVTARMAARFQRGLVQAGQRCTFASLTGATFTGEVLDTTSCGERPAVTVRVAGEAFYSGEARFWLEEGDRIGQGFRLK